MEQIVPDNNHHPIQATTYPDTAERPRLIIVGAGDYARYLTEIAIKKRFSIEGAFKRAGEHIGEDLGIACGMGREIGTKLEDVQTIAPNSARAEIAMVAAGPSISPNFDTYQRLLEGGYNVLCLAPEAFNPYFFDADTAKRIDALAKSNNVTFTGGGIWDMSRIWAGILATGPCTDIEEIIHTSATDVGRQVQSLEDIRRYRLAVGISVDEFRSGGYDSNPTGSYYPMMAAQVLEAIGYHVKDYTTNIEPVVLEEPMSYWLFDEPIPAGHCIGQRMTSELTTDEGVTARSTVDLRLFHDGEEEHMSWEVKGIPHLIIRILRDDSVNVTVTSQFNRIPDVIAAPPGIVLISQMGPLKHTALL